MDSNFPEQTKDQKGAYNKAEQSKLSKEKKGKKVCTYGPEVLYEFYNISKQKIAKNAAASLVKTENKRKHRKSQRSVEHSFPEVQSN